MSGSPTWFQPAIRRPSGMDSRPRVSSEPSALLAIPSPPVSELIVVLPVCTHPPGESAWAVAALAVVRAAVASTSAAARRHSADAVAVVNVTPKKGGRAAPGTAADRDG